MILQKNIRNSIPIEKKPTIQRVEELLKIIQNSTHPGIGARNLTECLTIQLKLINNQEKICNLAKKLIKNHLSVLETKIMRN